MPAAPSALPAFPNILDFVDRPSTQAAPWSGAGWPRQALTLLRAFAAGAPEVRGMPASGDGSDAFGASAPERIELEFLPRGGQLRLHAQGRDCSLFLPGQRCELMALLLQPPAPHSPGEIIEDDLLIARLWPHQTRTRMDLNTLVYRLRKDLARAGIDANPLIQRAPGGGGTRLGVAPDVTICVS